MAQDVVLNALAVLRQIALFALIVSCVYTDIARGKLYNSVTIAGLISGLLIGFLLDAGTSGFPHLKSAFLGALTGGGLLFIVYVVGGLGAGDVKLMAAIGALAADWRFVLIALMYTALVGAMIAAGILIWQGRLLSGLRDSAKTLLTFRVKRQKDRPASVIPYGVAIGIGTFWAWVELVLVPSA